MRKVLDACKVLYILESISMYIVFDPWDRPVRNGEVVDLTCEQSML